MLIEKIGKAAMLEQTAEEAVEFAFACLKYARFLRGDNKVYGYSEDELISKVTEEAADVDICTKELISGDVFSFDKYINIHVSKIDRMGKRLADADFETCRDGISKDLKETLNERYGIKTVVKGNCLVCGEKLSDKDDIFICKKCEKRG